MRIVIRILLLFSILSATGCALTPPPRNKENVGAIFTEYPQWYKAAKKAEQKWGIPVNVQMAIMYYESSFRADARPPRKLVLGFIPGDHLSSAYGYAQALDGTWDDYLAQAGGWFASRTKFESATDFIGWYSAQARDRLGIPQNDPYHLYLAYHEGLTGYERRSYMKKPWLIRYAKSVAMKSQIFQNQLAYYESGGAMLDMPMQNLPTIQLEEPNLEPPSYYVCKTSEPGIEEQI